ncbi:MAG: FliM/FliN family flagellar motor switch protein, partial [Treponema sp.]|nr:FliM/FliN family flagellar motor switch protein [Treponema sp.]
GTLKEKISDVEMALVAEIGSLNVPIRDVVGLRVGDVVRLVNTKITDPLTLAIGNKKKFFCQPGVVGKKMAIQVIGKIEEDDKDDFEELSTANEGEESI